MKIAIFGANSHIATDLVHQLAGQQAHTITLFCRRPAELVQRLQSQGLSGPFACSDYSTISHSTFDAILNFVGAGDPRRVAEMGAAIFDVTLEFDDIALAYLRKHPDCKYIFMSSGAVFGGSYSVPVTSETRASLPINALGPQDWYGASKLHAETRHRALAGLPIVDLRIYNYFSSRQDLDSKFFLCEALQCARTNALFRTNDINVFRDYVGPTDFHQLISKILDTPPNNMALDCYSASPVDKIALLEFLRSELGLRYEVVSGHATMNTTGNKTHYYSQNHSAAAIEYVPRFTSLETIRTEAFNML